MRSRVGVLVVGVFFIGVGAWAGEISVGVSPGSAGGVAQVESRCPTFSWAGVEGAKSYELVVYRLGADGKEAEAALRQSFPSAAYSWTPSLGSCLERGGQYAWSVRARTPDGASDWSEPSVFAVAAEPSAEEVRMALDTLSRYQGREGSDGPPEAESALRVEAAPVEEARKPRPGRATRGMTPPGITTDGNYEWETARTGIISVPGNSFISYGDSSPYSLSRNVNGYTFVSSGPISPFLVNMGADLQLPNVSTVTRLVCFYYDNTNGGGITANARLLEKAPDGSSAGTPMAEIDFSTTGGFASGAVQDEEDLSINSAGVSSLNHYYLFVSWSQSLAGSNIRFYGCDVYYTYFRVVQ